MNDILESTTVSEQTPGQILKAAREAKQIGIGEIAQRLLLSKTTIAAIEEDDYSRISAPVYAEGYLKAYAQFLQIPVDAVLDSFRRLNIYSKAEATTETRAQAQDQVCRCRCRELSNLLKGQCRGHVILGAFVVLILAVLVIFFGKQFFGKGAGIIHVPNSLTNAINKNGEDEVIQVPNSSPNSLTNAVNKNGSEGEAIQVLNSSPNNLTNAIAINKNGNEGEAIQVLNSSPNNLTNTIAINKNGKDDDKVISDNQMPMITTTANMERAVVSGSEVEAVSKKKHGSKKIDRPGAQDVSLMLDANSTAGKGNEPNLILTKTKNAVE
ncbi:cytoskeleton protein RodZ [Gammaproteobacteria bacterium]